MQSHTSKESIIKISPNLLKNFNVYDMLEPEKNGAKSSDATKVDKLIDIDECSRDSGFQDSDLHPAFLDKNRDFDLVDLFQNIFVTPQHIKKNEAIDEVDTSDTTVGESKVFDAGFKQFFDMLESGQKIDWTNLDQSEEEAFTKHKFIEKKPKILVPKVFKEPDSDPEDIINEVLTQKKLEKLVFDSISNSPKYASSPKDPHNPSEAKQRESPKIKKTDVISESSRFNSINGIAKGFNFEIGTNETEPRPSETYPVNDSLNKFTVRAIQKDEKVYKKKRLQKPESQTANYTPGPHFYEKSVVLPQIIARLDARLAYLNEKGNQKKRLILDAGAKSEKAESTSNANEQVKKKANNPVSSSMPKAKELVLTKITKNEVPKKVTHIAGSSGINSLQFNNIKEEVQLCINKVSKDIGIHTTDQRCLNCGKLPTPNKVESPVAAEYGKASPVVLMEDCNKERLRNLKQSQMFKNFVLNGKFDF